MNAMKDRRSFIRLIPMDVSLASLMPAYSHPLQMIRVRLVVSSVITALASHFLRPLHQRKQHIKGHRAVVPLRQHSKL